MQRARPPPGSFPLLAERLPIPFQCSPYGFPILRRRLHDYFFGLLLDEPRSQRSQLFRVTAKHPSLKHARSGSDRWTVSNSPLINATSPLRAVAILPLSDFHKVSRAEGPKKTDGMRRPVSAGCDTLPMFDVLKAQ